MLRRIAVCGLVVPFVLLPVEGASSSAPSCQGQPATIVGEPGEQVVGTDGPDVIVSNGAKYVFGEDGDDLLCMTKQLGRERFHAIGGSGDDSILVTGDRYTHVSPGSGDDTVTGGPGREKVYLGAEDASSTEPGVDTIHTGGGPDLVVAYHHEVIRDLVELGSGDDAVRLENGNQLAPNAELDGGRGSNYLAINHDGEIPGDSIVIDNDLQRASVDGTVTQHWARFDRFAVANTGFGSVRFVGSGADEEFNVEPLAASVEAVMGLGDDQVFVDGPAPGGTTVDGQQGQDKLILQYQGHIQVTLDVGPGTAVTSAADQGGVTFAGLEQYYLSAGRVTMIGDRHANILAATAKGAVIRGGAGGDSISCWNDQYYGHGCGRVVLEGNGGNDDLIGGAANDLINGGPGRDRANGRKGTDRCVAVEDRNDCEKS